AGGRLDAGEGDRAVLAFGDLADQGLVEEGQDAAGAADPHGGSPDGVADEAGDRGRVGALAADVADDDGPTALDHLEDVEEVAADLVALATGAVTGGHVEAGDGGELRGEEGLLEDMGDAGALLVQARVVDGHRRAP